jgi:hypothetical protein
MVYLTALLTAEKYKLSNNWMTVNNKMEKKHKRILPWPAGHQLEGTEQNHENLQYG